MSKCLICDVDAGGWEDCGCHLLVITEREFVRRAYQFLTPKDFPVFERAADQGYMDLRGVGKPGQCPLGHVWACWCCIFKCPRAYVEDSPWLSIAVSPGFRVEGVQRRELEALGWDCRGTAWIHGHFGTSTKTWEQIIQEAMALVGIPLKHYQIPAPRSRYDVISGVEVSYGN